MPMYIEPSPEISHRTDFALLANARGYRTAVEVGVDQGVFAREFMSRWNGDMLSLVDDYAGFPDFPYDRTTDMLAAVQALAPYHGRVRFLRLPSVEAARWMAGKVEPDLVYIDADHSEESVYEDMVSWWDLIPWHGMLAGHDHDASHPGVCFAVQRFARERGLTVRLTQEALPSWYVYRSEPAELIIRHFRQATVPNPKARRW